MMARIIAADDWGNGVVETNAQGCFVVAHSEHQKLKVGDYLGGWSSQPQEVEVEVWSMKTPGRNQFKLTKEGWFPDAEQALNDLRSNSPTTKLRVRVPPYRTSKPQTKQ
ncbi:MAG TPA: hypothetical protein VMD27_01150 [Candidatus Aquilonibacter sp.]|nr:hypothetical protein [Candidatus Aquilonibacter sp.]